MKRVLEPFAGRVVRVASRRVAARGATDADFLALAADAAHAPTGAVLLSGSEHECARHSIAAWSPFMTMQARRGTARFRMPDGERVLRGDPLDLLDRALASFQPGFPLGSAPFAGGAVGYLAYDLKNAIERLPRRARGDRQLPDLFLFWPRRILVHDRASGEVEELVLSYDGDAAVNRPSSADAATRGDPPGAPRCGKLVSATTRPAYLRSIERIREYIRNGDVYQVNLSQRFAAPFRGDPFLLWQALYRRNPAPFYAFIQAGTHQVASTSMERFLRVACGKVESRPIKGTRPRGATPVEDEAARDELARSPKDDAELSMIVDLIRNDLGRVCRTGSVRVAAHKRPESYANVHHLVSVVEGTLRDDVTAGALLRAAFPGGSITGCPKIRAMQIIDELEPCARHIYTGTIGYIGMHGNLDLSVAIRTALVHRGTCSFSVGGGIVYDSKADDEYEETLHKGQTFFDVMSAAGGS
jgi:para-aminobenzoate synthetase component 1